MKIAHTFFKWVSYCIKEQGRGGAKAWVTDIADTVDMVMEAADTAVVSR